MWFFLRRESSLRVSRAKYCFVSVLGERPGAQRRMHGPVTPLFFFGFPGRHGRCLIRGVTEMGYKRIWPGYSL